MKFCCASSRVKTSSFPLTNAKSERATLSSFEEEKEDEDAASELLLVLLLAKHSRHTFSWMRGGNMRTNLNELWLKKNQIKVIII